MKPIFSNLKSKIQNLKSARSVLLLLLGGLLFRGVVALWLYPGFDEAYYYIYSLNLDWSYFDHPVLVALLTGFGPWLTGEVSQFTIRLGTLILYTGSLLLLYLTSAKLFSAQAGRITLAIATIIPIFQVAFGILTLPDSPLIFFWTASLYCAADEFFSKSRIKTLIGASPVPPSGSVLHEKEVNSFSPHREMKSGHGEKEPASREASDPKGSRRGQKSKIEPNPYQPSYRLAMLGVLVGLACLGKYHGFVLGLGLVGFCLTSSRSRAALLSPWAWLGLALFILTIFPIWFWNMQHDWVSFGFQLNRGVPRRDYNLLQVGIVFLVGLGYLFPTFGLPLWWVSWQSVLSQIKQFFSKTPLTDREDLQQKQLLILWVSLPLTVGFTLMGGYQQILPTWAMPGFWGLTLLLGQKAVIWQQQSRRWVRRWVKGSGIIVGTSLLLTLLHVATGTLQSGSRYAILGGFWHPQDDPSTELIDIQQLRQGFAESPVLSEALQDSSFIFTNGYYLAGQIGMALIPLSHTPITCFSPDMRGFAFWSKPDRWLGQDALYITLDRFHHKKELTDRYRAYFSSLQEIGTVPIRRGGAVTEVIHVSRAKTLLKPYPRPYGNEIR